MLSHNCDAPYQQHFPRSSAHERAVGLFEFLATTYDIFGTLAVAPSRPPTEPVKETLWICQLTGKGIGFGRGMEIGRLMTSGKPDKPTVRRERVGKAAALE